MGPSDRDRRVRRRGSRAFASAWIVALAVASTGACGSLVGVSDLHFVDGGPDGASGPSRGDETIGGAGPDGSIEPDADGTDATSLDAPILLDAAGDACSATPVCNPGSTCRAGCSQTLTCSACGQWPGTCAPCSLTFSYTGAAQTFSVPDGVTEVTIEAFGAQGCMGGLGGSTTATIMVTKDETLTIAAGGGGCDGTGANYNGGGLSDALYLGPGGGGASDVRQGGTDLSNRIVVAGGGGAAGVVNGAAQSAGGAGAGRQARRARCPRVGDPRAVGRRRPAAWPATARAAPLRSKRPRRARWASAAPVASASRIQEPVAARGAADTTEAAEAPVTSRRSLAAPEARRTQAPRRPT